MWEGRRLTKTSRPRASLSSAEGSGGGSPLEGSCREWFLMLNPCWGPGGACWGETRAGSGALASEIRLLALL